MICLQYNANLRNSLVNNAISQIKTQRATLFFTVVAHRSDGVWGGNCVVRSFSTLNFYAGDTLVTVFLRCENL